MAGQRSSFGEQNVRRAGRRADLHALTPAEAHALSRSAPLTPAQFKAIGRTAEQRVDALRSVLNAEAEHQPHIEAVIGSPTPSIARAGVAVLAWCLARVERPSFRVRRARMDAAGERLRELLDKESQKARLLRLDVVSPSADAPEVALSPSDDAATSADRLFARCAGGDARLHYDRERGHWSACVPLFERGPTVAFVVDERDRRRPFEALLAALEIVAADAPPVIDAEHPPDAACVRFDANVGRWQAYHPCDACGGGWLNTMFDDLDHAPLARLAARGLLADDEGREHDAPVG